MQSASIRIASRGSPLALAQARMVRDQLAAAHGIDPQAIEIRIVRTSGDVIQDRPLSEVGGKGLFTKEIEEALLRHEADLAVHSAKDMQTQLPAGLVIAGCLPREDPRDALVSRTGKRIADLAPGARIGTSSLRRAAMMRRLRPDIVVVPLRGNVETRLRKLDEGVADATLLALAGLRRLGLEAVASAVLDPNEFVPAVGQGVIALETRADDTRIRELIAKIDDATAATTLGAERAFLSELDGSCKTPIAGHARLVDGELRFHGLIVKPDGSCAYEAVRTGPARDAEKLGADAGRELKHKAGPDFFVLQ
ncbi:MAG: hydroxymethylbilane synthase [Xanthobacteraceae bacterium]|nr:hydroxymethylbilane synthase [Xanthobacteraceae bacterium]MBV9630350.1 hydroxymethylbilane synthase [Xanthobacteraceae bacterium]